MAGYIGSKSSGIISGIDASIAELNLNDKASANGTTEANKVLTADGNKDVTAIRNLTATGTVTRALTRGSIDVGNSSGVSSALAKGAAGTVLTSDGTDLSFVAASGGGEQTFTATGAVSNGDIVGLNFDGTISVMSQKAGSPTDASSADVDSSRATAIAYDSTNNKVLYVYNTADPTMSAVVGTVSGNSISFGTPVNVVSSGAQSATVCFDSNAGKFAIMFRDYTASGISAIVATISGTSVSFGSKATVDSEPAAVGVGAAIFDPDQNAIIYARMGTSNHGRISAGAISGTSISWGSTVEYSTDYVENNLSFDLTYDTSANKTILVYKRLINNTSGDIYYRTVTTSGTSISLGTQRVLYASTSTYAEPRCVYSPAANKTFFAYAQGSSLETVVGTLSGDTFSFGTTNSNISGTPVSGTAYHRLYNYNPDTEEIIESSIYYYGTAQTANYKIVGTNHYAQTYVNIVEGLGTTAADHLGTCYDTGSNKMVISFRDDAKSDKPQALVYDPAVPTNWVGLASEAISNGASGKVTIIGGINTGQSGLVAGVPYKVTPTSSSLSESTGNIVGTALSASSIYLTKAAI